MYFSYYSLNSFLLIIHKPLLLLSDMEQPPRTLFSLAQLPQAANFIRLLTHKPLIFKIKYNVQKTQTRTRKKKFPMQLSQAANFISLLTQSLVPLFKIKYNVQKTQTRPRKKKFPMQFSHKSFPQSSPKGNRGMINLQNQKNYIFSLNLNFEFFCTDYFLIKLIEAEATHWVISKIVYGHMDVALNKFLAHLCAERVSGILLTLRCNWKATIRPPLLHHWPLLDSEWEGAEVCPWSIVQMERCPTIAYF